MNDNNINDQFSLRQRDLSFAPSCKIETCDLGGGCMDCRAPSLHHCPSPVYHTKINIATNHNRINCHYPVRVHNCV
jgi:hypothetical protein